MKTNQLTRKNMKNAIAGIEVENTIVQGEFDLNDCLMQVTTAPAAAQDHGIAYSTVTSAISRKRLDAVKVMGVWIIRKVDADRLWGSKQAHAARLLIGVAGFVGAILAIATVA